MSPVWNPGGSSAPAPVWRALENFGATVVVLGAPFLPDASCAEWNGLLLLRGLLSLDAAGSGFRVFDVPAAITAPTAIRRLLVQTAGQAVTGLNFNTDRTVTLAAGCQTFIDLDGCSIASWS